jgi:hypothetical protein
LKRRNELQRTQAEAQLKLLRIKQQNESEALGDLERSKLDAGHISAPTSLASLPPMQSSAQIEAKKQLDKFETERKAQDDMKRQQEL